jgi:hypothetical protein
VTGRRGAKSQLEVSLGSAAIHSINIGGSHKKVKEVSNDNRTEMAYARPLQGSQLGWAQPFQSQKYLKHAVWSKPSKTSFGELGGAMTRTMNYEIRCLAGWPNVAESRGSSLQMEIPGSFVTMVPSFPRGRQCQTPAKVPRGEALHHIL